MIEDRVVTTRSLSASTDRGRSRSISLSLLSNPRSSYTNLLPAPIDLRGRGVTETMSRRLGEAGLSILIISSTSDDSPNSIMVSSLRLTSSSMFTFKLESAMNSGLCGMSSTSSASFSRMGQLSVRGEPASLSRDDEGKSILFSIAGVDTTDGSAGAAAGVSLAGGKGKSSRRSRADDPFNSRPISSTDVAFPSSFIEEEDSVTFDFKLSPR